MNLLDAVNTVLPQLGEHPVTAIDVAHPTVDLILLAIERQRNFLLSEGWWFNEATLTLPVNTDGRIDTPIDILSIYGVDCNVEIDGEKLFDLDNNTRYFTSPITVEVKKDIAFEKLPIYAQLYITYLAASEVYVADFGLENAVQLLEQKAEQNRQKLVQENIRKRKYNTSVLRKPRKYSHNSILFR